MQHNSLNDSHAQLMVHWLGEGTNVMICLARDPPLGPNDDPNVTTTTPSTSNLQKIIIQKKMSNKKNNLNYSFHFLRLR